MRYSVLLSLHERDSIDLQKTFKQLAKASSGRDDLEFIVGFDFDRDDERYKTEVALAEIFEESLDCPVTLIEYDTVAKHPETFHLDTHCNPVAINNALMDAARGDNIVWISSDMIVSPLLFERIDLHLDAETGLLDTVWCARVIDQDSMAEYCGPSRPFPMMWCVAHPHTGERHDLELLKGFGFDDNDWMARMGMKLGSITIDLVCIAIHQTHGKVTQVGQLASGKAYSVESKPGWVRSTKYINEKWGGCPFDGKTLKVGFGEVGEFLVLNIDGLQNPPLARTNAKPKRLKAADCTGAKRVRKPRKSRAKAKA